MLRQILLRVLRLPGALAVRRGQVSFWNLDDTADRVGPNTLGNTNGVTFTAGKVGNAATFVRASGQLLSHARNASLDVDGRDWTIAFWCKLVSKPDDMGLVSMWNGGGSFVIWYQAEGVDRLAVNTGDGAFVSGTTFGSPPTGTWFLVCVRRAGAVLGLSVNAGAADTTAVGAIAPTADGFAVGAFFGGNCLDGQIDALGKWDRALTDAEVSYLYNGGDGREYPF